MAAPTVNYTKNGVTVTQDFTETATATCPNATKAITATNFNTVDYALKTENPGEVVIVNATSSAAQPKKQIRYGLKTVNSMASAFPISYEKGRNTKGSQLVVEVSSIYDGTVTADPSKSYQIPARCWCVFQTSSDVAWDTAILDAMVRDVFGACYATDATGNSLLKKCLMGALNPLA